MKTDDRKIETLHANEWVSLCRMRAPSRGVSGYVYSHESRCGGQIVACLPYRKSVDPLSHREFNEFLLRVEVTPCWGLDAIASAVTGGVDPSEAPSTTMLRELREETGYEVARERLLSLGMTRGTKSCDTIYHLYAAPVHGLIAQDLIGDGSALEAEATVWWTEHPWESEDPLVAAMWARLVQSFEWSENWWHQQC